jgi:hypothetical protein
MEASDDGRPEIRMGGMASLAGAALAGWLFIARPLQQAASGAARISFQGKIAYVLVPALIVYGAAFLLGGENARYRDTSTHPPRLTPLGWVLMILTLAAAGLCFWWVEAQFSALGYRSTY